MLVRSARPLAYAQADTERLEVWFQAGTGSRQSHPSRNQQQNKVLTSK
jgi:hypothetical protein